LSRACNIHDDLSLKEEEKESQTPMRRILQDETLQKSFEQTGYACFPLLNKEEVQHILDELATLRPNDKFAPEGSNRPDITYHCSFLDTNVEYKRQTKELISSIFTPHIEKHLANFQIHHCNFNIKPPHAGEFPVHQNWPGLADLNDTTVTFWCPLLDVVGSNGALQVVEGSHKIVPHVEGPNSPCYFRDFKEDLIRKHLRPIPMKAGGCVVFDDGLIHWSAKNDSDKPRIAIQILCTPKNVQPVFFFFDPKKPSHFELIEADENFYIETPIPDLMTRQPNWKSLGFIENRNRYLTESEFVELLKNGDTIRRNLPPSPPILEARPAAAAVPNAVAKNSGVPSAKAFMRKNKEKKSGLLSSLFGSLIKR
jgi:Phytanoyl-CoA dioxygenase (PhyH)